MSSENYDLLKRPDELFVVEKAHRHPRFVEDTVREMLRSFVNTYPGAAGRRLRPRAAGEHGDDPQARRVRPARRAARRDPGRARGRSAPRQHRARGLARRPARELAGRRRSGPRPRARRCGAPSRPGPRGSPRSRARRGRRLPRTPPPSTISASRQARAEPCRAGSVSGPVRAPTRARSSTMNARMPAAQASAARSVASASGHFRRAAEEPAVAMVQAEDAVRPAPAGRARRRSDRRQVAHVPQRLGADDDPRRPAGRRRGGRRRPSATPASSQTDSPRAGDRLDDRAMICRCRRSRRGPPRSRRPQPRRSRKPRASATGSAEGDSTLLTGA